MPIYEAGQRIRASELNTLPQTYYVETDQVKNNSATPSNITGLSFAAEANARYVIEGMMFCSSGTTPDIRFYWTVPAGTTGIWTTRGVHLPVNSRIGAIDTGLVAIANSLPVSGDSGGVPGFSFGPSVSIKIGSTAGTVQAQFSQDTANASDTKILAGSFLRVHQI